MLKNVNKAITVLEQGMFKQQLAHRQEESSRQRAKVLCGIKMLNMLKEGSHIWNWLGLQGIKVSLEKRGSFKDLAVTLNKMETKRKT